MALGNTLPGLARMCIRSAMYSTKSSTLAITPKIIMEQCTNDAKTPIVVVFSWLGANQRNSQKYVDCWTKRGHNVLLVKTPVKDLLCPKTGTNVTAAQVIDYLNERQESEVIFHGLSVGGYLTQKVLMNANTTLHDRISHVIYDSFTCVEGIEAGVLQATPRTLKGIISAIIRSYTRVADLSSFNDAQNYVLSSDLPIPTYFLHSKADVVAPYNVVKKIMDARMKFAPVDILIFPESENIPHVSILKHVGEKQYMDLILNFVAKH